ncbi:MAG: hypothetical protein AB7E52_01020 [Bdellovibrionales bacterium]
MKTTPNPCIRPAPTFRVFAACLLALLIATPTAQAKETTQTYTDKEFGLSFDYPAAFAENPACAPRKTGKASLSVGRVGITYAVKEAEFLEAYVLLQIPVLTDQGASEVKLKQDEYNGQKRFRLTFLLPVSDTPSEEIFLRNKNRNYTFALTSDDSCVTSIPDAEVMETILSTVRWPN